MIEDEELKIKLAESHEEAFWVDLKEKIQKNIESHKHEITINEAIIELAEKKIKEENDKR